MRVFEPGESDRVERLRESALRSHGGRATRTETRRFSRTVRSSFTPFRWPM